MGKDGIYSVWIAMRRYPCIPPVDYHDRGQTGANIMKPLSKVIVIEDGATTVGELKRLLAEYEFHGFPVIDKHHEFVGYATRQELRAALSKKSCCRPFLLHHSPFFFLSEDHLQIDESDVDRHKKCTFSPNRMRLAIDERVDLSSALEDSIIQLRKEVPQELVVNMFQKLVRQIHLLFPLILCSSIVIEFASNPVYACWQTDRLGNKKGCSEFVDQSFTSCRCVVRAPTSYTAFVVTIPSRLIHYSLGLFSTIL